MPRKQAKRVKNPRSQRIASRLTKLTLGGALLLGRTTARVAIGVGKGTAEVAHNVREGYYDACDELLPEDETENKS